jgi:hypothetical protein
MLEPSGAGSVILDVMRKAGHGYFFLALALMLVAVLVFLPSGAGPGALDREMAFTGGLLNSLYHLDLAKAKWAEEKHKSEGDLPTMEDLMPYLGDWTNGIKRFVACGVEYKITPISEMESQSDIATLTRNVCFQTGFCRFYAAGTRFSLHTGWAVPKYGSTAWVLAAYHNNRGLLAAALFVSGIASLLVLAVKKVRSSGDVGNATHEHQNA